MTTPLSRIVIEKGIVKGFLCISCRGYNDILNEHCIFCQTDSGIDIDRGLVALRRDIYYMPERDEELHAKFYNEEAVFIANMSIEEVIKRTDFLENIAFEARSKHGCAKNRLRELKTNLTPEELEKFETRADFTSSERSKVPKRDKVQLTAADKARKGFEGLGLSEEMIESMMAQIKFPKGSEANPLTDLRVEKVDCICLKCGKKYELAAKTEWPEECEDGKCKGEVAPSRWFQDRDLKAIIKQEQMQKALEDGMRETKEKEKEQPLSNSGKDVDVLIHPKPDLWSGLK